MPSLLALAGLWLLVLAAASLLVAGASSLSLAMASSPSGEPAGGFASRFCSLAFAKLFVPAGLSAFCGVATLLACAGLLARGSLLALFFVLWSESFHYSKILVRCFHFGGCRGSRGRDFSCIVLRAALANENAVVVGALVIDCHRTGAAIAERLFSLGLLKTFRVV